MNNVSKNLFSQVDEEGNRFLFDNIVDHLVYGTETMQQGVFFISNNGGKRQRDNTKGW